MLIFTCIILFVLAIIIFFIFGRKIKLLSYKISFIILLILLVIICYFLTKVIYKTNTTSSSSSKQLNDTSYNSSSNLVGKDLNIYKSKTTIIVGSTAKLTPWSYQKNKVVLGYNIDLIKEAVKLMGKKIHIVVYNNEKDLYSALKQKKIDIIADFGLFNKDNDFTYSIKIVNPPFVFVSNKQHHSNLLKNHDNGKMPYENFLNKSIVTEDLSLFTTFLNDLLGKNATFTVLSNSDDVLSSVEKSKFDVGFVEYFSFLYYKNNHPKSKLITVSPLISIKNVEGIGFIVNSSDLVLQQQLNIALNLLKRRGEMSNLSIKYFKEDVTL